MNDALDTQKIRIGELATENTDLIAENAALREALTAICDKMDAMEKPLNGLCMLGHVHGMPYAGPNWAEEYKRARALLGEKA